jgi:hypothetical protein
MSGDSVARRGFVSRIAADLFRKITARVTRAKNSALKVAGAFPSSADAFSDDANSALRCDPEFRALTAEAKISNTPLRVIAGVNNGFDEDCYNRVRPDGVSSLRVANRMLATPWNSDRPNVHAHKKSFRPDTRQDF